MDRSSPDNVTVTAARNNVQTETCYATAMSQHLMLYAVFDNFHALSNPIRQDILRGGGRKSTFLCFLTLEFEFLTTYEVSRPLHRRKPFIETFIIFPRFQGTISTSTGSSNLLPNFTTVFFGP